MEEGAMKLVRDMAFIDKYHVSLPFKLIMFSNWTLNRFQKQILLPFPTEDTFTDTAHTLLLSLRYCESWQDIAEVCCLFNHTDYIDDTTRSVLQHAFAIIRVAIDDRGGEAILTSAKEHIAQAETVRETLKNNLSGFLQPEAMQTLFNLENAAMP